MGYIDIVSSISKKAGRPSRPVPSVLTTMPEAALADARTATKDVTTERAESVSPTVRAVALDAFRGLAIAVMLLVNNAALDEDVPKNMTHAAFGQMPTLADMVFPWFLLAVGIAIPFSVASAQAKGATHRAQLWQTARRVVALYAVGIVVDSCVRRTLYFGTGVLQLIALVSGAARLLYVPNRWGRLGIIAGLLVGYGVALTSLPIAGFHPGPFSATHNLSQYINETYLHPYTLDGLLSIIPTTALALIGTFIGEELRQRAGKPRQTLYLILASGSALTVIGLLWSQNIVMNKQYWTPSYICYAGGLGLLALGLFYALGDMLAPRNPLLQKIMTPFVIFGSNPLIAYAGAILVKTLILQRWMVTVNGKDATLQDAFMNDLVEHQGRIIGGWMYMAIYLLAVWLVCAILYRRRIFVRV